MKSLNALIFFLSFAATLSGKEAVICRDLLIRYDLSQLEAELCLVEDRYMPLRDLRDNWTAVSLRNATGTDSREGIELNFSVKNQWMLPCKNTQILEKLPYMQFILKDIAERFNTEVGLVRISKILSQKEIIPHSDGNRFDIDKGTIYRLHIPIVTGEHVIFEIDKKEYNLKAGTLYYANVSKNHSVINNGPTDRVHLVIDVQASKALYEHIRASPELES